LREARHSAQDNLYRLCSEGVRLAIHDTAPAIIDGIRRGGLPPLALLVVDGGSQETPESLIEVAAFAREQELRLAIVDIGDDNRAPFVELLGQRWDLVTGLSIGAAGHAFEVPPLHR
jgi:hypothetical protein